MKENINKMSHQEKLELAGNPQTPTEILDQLAEHEDVSLQVAKNPNCSAAILEKLAKSQSENLRLAIASHSNCSEKIFKRFAKISNEWIRSETASNSALPDELLLQLSCDASPQVRESVARNPKCTAELLKALALDEDLRVLAAVAGNLKTPAASLAKIHAKTNIKKLIAMEVSDRWRECDSMQKVLVAIISNPNCPEDLKQKAIELPPCSFPNNKKLESVTKPLTQLKALISKARQSHADHEFFEENSWLDDIEFCGPAWGFRTVTLPTRVANRFRSMFQGPFYTSESYPWPTLESGIYASPLLQLDLREAREVSRSCFGDGLLQLFERDGDDFIIRVIPRSEISEDQITPYPDQGPDIFESYTIENSWACKSNPLVTHIIGYQEPFLSAELYAEADEDAPKIFHQIVSKMEALRDQSMEHSGPHLFGTFPSIQYRPHEISGEVLVSLDGMEGYVWGDDGNAQLFFKRDGEQVHFFIESSCY